MKNVLNRFLERGDRSAGWVAACIVIAGLGYSMILGPELRYPDEGEYLSIAENMVSNGLFSMDGEHSTAYRPPGYPFIMAPFVALGAGPVTLRSLNFLALAWCLFLLGKLLPKELRKPGTAMAAVLVVGYPVLFYTAGTLYPQTVSTALFLAFLVVALGPDGIAKIRPVLAGTLMGLLILTVSTFLFALALTLAYLALVRGQWRNAFIIGIISTLIVGSWTVRNTLVFDRVVPMATNSGINLLLGNSPNTTANSGVNVDLSTYLEQTEGMDEVERDAFLKQAAIDHIKSDPTAALGLYVRKVVNFFNYRNELATASERSVARELLVLIPYAVILLLVIWRCAQFRTRPLSQLEWFILVLYVSSAFFHAIFFTRIRFRLPLDTLLIAIAAGQAAYLWRRYLARSAPAAEV
ncbi:MAG: hypothetical protein KDB88_03515 [Flavobacteriales bacterium]|nr:hypothetical protein [Flavobacteriales bacterium]